MQHRHGSASLDEDDVVVPYDDGGVAAVLTASPFNAFCRAAGSVGGPKPLIRGRYNGLQGGDPMLRRAPEVFEHMTSPDATRGSGGPTVPVLVEAYSRSAAGKTVNPEYLRTSSALEKSMHFLVEHYLRHPHTPLVYTNPFVIWRYLWDRMRGVRTTWVPQLPHGGPEGNLYYEEASGQPLPTSTLHDDCRSHIRWLEFTVAALAVGAAYLCSTPPGCRQFMQEKKNFLESMSQCFTDLTVWYRAAQRHRNAEFLSLLLLLYGLHQETKGEDRALFCEFYGFTLTDGSQRRAPEPAGMAVNLQQTYKEIEKQPALIATHAVRVAMDLINAWATRSWFEFFHLCRHAHLTPLQKAVVYQSFTYARFRAVLDLVTPNYAVYAKLRVRHAIGLAELADLLMMEEEHCVQMLHAMGLSDSVDLTTGTLRLSSDNSEPLVDAERLENCKKEHLVYPTYPEYFGFTVWEDAFTLFPGAPFAAMETATTASTSDPAGRHAKMLRSAGCPVNLMTILEPYCPPYHERVASLRLVDTDEKWFLHIRAHRQRLLAAHVAARREPGVRPMSAGDYADAVSMYDRESASTGSDVFSSDEEGSSVASPTLGDGGPPSDCLDGANAVAGTAEECGAVGPPIIREAQRLIDGMMGDSRYQKARDAYEQSSRTAPAAQARDPTPPAEAAPALRTEQPPSIEVGATVTAAASPLWPALPDIARVQVLPVPDDGADATAPPSPTVRGVVESPQSVLLPLALPNAAWSDVEDVEPLPSGLPASAGCVGTAEPTLPFMACQTGLPPAPSARAALRSTEPSEARPPWSGVPSKPRAESTSVAPATFGTDGCTAVTAIPTQPARMPAPPIPADTHGYRKETQPEGHMKRRREDDGTTTPVFLARDPKAAEEEDAVPSPHSVDTSRSGDAEHEVSIVVGQPPCARHTKDPSHDGESAGVLFSHRKPDAPLSPTATPSPSAAATGSAPLHMFITPTRAGTAAPSRTLHPSAQSAPWRHRAFLDVRTTASSCAFRCSADVHSGGAAHGYGDPRCTSFRRVEDDPDAVCTSPEVFLAEHLAPVLNAYLTDAISAIGCDPSAARALLYATLSASMLHSDMRGWRREIFQASRPACHATAKSGTLSSPSWSSRTDGGNRRVAGSELNITAERLAYQDRMIRRLCVGFTPYTVTETSPPLRGGSSRCGLASSPLFSVPAEVFVKSVTVCKGPAITSVEAAERFVSRLGMRCASQARHWAAARTGRRFTVTLQDDDSASAAPPQPAIHGGGPRRGGADPPYSPRHQHLGLTLSLVLVSSGSNPRIDAPTDCMAHLFASPFERRVAASVHQPLADDGRPESHGVNSYWSLGAHETVASLAVMQRVSTRLTCNVETGDVEAHPLSLSIELYAASVSVLPKLQINPGGAPTLRLPTDGSVDDTTIAVACPHLTAIVCVDTTDTHQRTKSVAALQQIAEMAAAAQWAEDGNDAGGQQPTAVPGVLVLVHAIDDAEAQRASEDVTTVFWQAYDTHLASSGCRGDSMKESFPMVSRSNSRSGAGVPSDWRARLSPKGTSSSSPSPSSKWARRTLSEERCSSLAAAPSPENLPEPAAASSDILQRPVLVTSAHRRGASMQEAVLRGVRALVRSFGEEVGRVLCP